MLLKFKNYPRLKKAVIILGIIIIIFIFTLLYARFIGAKGLEVHEYKITNSIISENFHGLKIVHISDLHYGRTIFKKELEQLVKKVNLLKPDIVVLTGDLIENDKSFKTNTHIISDILSKIEARINKYAISGNHDVKFDTWETIINDSGFINLNDNYDIIYNGNDEALFIGGISSSYYDKKAKEKVNTINDAFNLLTNTKINYRILLMHEPDFVDEIDYNNFNLILAGHSHNGQVRIPFKGAIILPKYAKKYYKGYYKIQNTDMYISSGVGTSTVGFRLFNKPSINLYRLTNK